MAYTRTNFMTGKAFREAVERGDRVEAYQPGPFGPEINDGWHCFEGPHYPMPHRWYVGAIVKDGIVVKIQKSGR